MEQCGENLRKRSVVSEDRISELPEDLILKILSYPTRKVITTSVLSKRWRSLWKMVPNIKFDYNNHRSPKFSENVGTTLLSHKAPVLESLHLIISDGSYKDIGKWIKIAFARHVRVLVLHLYFRRGSLRFSRRMFSFNNTFETLELAHSVLVDVPSPFCIKSLKTMHFHRVEFKDDASFCNLIASCPNLKNLVMSRIKILLTFVIEAPSLKRLSIRHYASGLMEKGGYVINAPSLKYLKIKGLIQCGCCLIENAPVLVKATIRRVFCIANQKIMGSLKSTKRLLLELSPLEIIYPTGSIFYQLIHLEMYTRQPKWWNLLALMLDSAPKLQS